MPLDQLSAILACSILAVLGIVMNGISRSKPERLIMTPTAVILAALYLVLALS